MFVESREMDGSNRLGADDDIRYSLERGKLTPESLSFLRSAWKDIIC